MTRTDCVQLYNTMVRVALRRLESLREEPEIAAFLEAGLDARDLVQVHLACQQIACVLGLPMDETGVVSRRARRLGTGRRVSASAHGTPVPDPSAAEGQ